MQTGISCEPPQCKGDAGGNHPYVTQTATRPALRVEACPRWVRGLVNGVPIVDSKRVIIVYGAQRQPTYFFPITDVRMDLLQPARTQAQPGEQRFTLEMGGRTIEDVAWTYTDLAGERAALRDHIAFEWRKIDAWYEEDDEVFVRPRDPYHRVDVLNSSRHIKVVIGGEVVAETRRPRLLFETGLRTRYYIPKVDVRMDLLEPTATLTQCPYKGNATYWSARIGDEVFPDIVWSYPFPIPECPTIQNLLSFYNEKVEIYVDGELDKAPSPR
jgi:uncharacterized protein (DUF427 family)